MEGAGRDKVILGSGTRQRHVRTRRSRARNHTEQILASWMSHFHSTVSSSCRCHRSTESLYTRFFHDPVRRPSSFPSSSLPRPRQPKGTDHDLVFATPIRAGLLLLPLIRLPRESRSTDFHLRDIFSLSFFFLYLVAPSRSFSTSTNTSSDSFFFCNEPEFLSIVFFVLVHHLIFLGARFLFNTFFFIIFQTGWHNCRGK